MRTRIQKWEGQLIIRIPEAVAGRLDLNENSLVELSIENGRIVVQPVTEVINQPGSLPESILPDPGNGAIDSGPVDDYDTD